LWCLVLAAKNPKTPDEVDEVDHKLLYTGAT
jgi:hypothetical protein